MNNAKTILIPIHSFVDLITNSSSETFISATDETVNVIKEIVNNLLAIAGDKRKFDDIFTANIVYRVDYRHERRAGDFIKKYEKRWNYYRLSQEQLEELAANMALNDDEKESFISDITCGERSEGCLEIKVKIETPELNVEIAKRIATALQNIINTYDTSTWDNN